MVGWFCWLDVGWFDGGLFGDLLACDLGGLVIS